ncbi:MAG: 5-methyltetrahydrofolate--homocysteine methyltransferase [Miltoncostaeaceae bacterium]|nr:5-methyltetrahydrofolate--homocysteine methyltransferase [Miltoncostaeaceae bacterium]
MRNADAYLRALREGTVIFDGAMGTQIQAAGLTAADFGGGDLEGANDYLSLTRPELIEGIHRAYLEAGAQAVETNSFQATHIRLQEWRRPDGGTLGEVVLEINRAAAQIARRACDDYERADGRPRFVAGSIGPSGMLPGTDDPKLSAVGFDALAEEFRVQAGALMEGGVDLLLIETQQDILETRAAIHGCRLAFADLGRRVPIQAQVALDQTGRMLLGTDIGAVMVILQGMGADVIGANCSVGPEHLREPVGYLCERARVPIAVIPNAGLPRNVGGVAHYDLGPDAMASQLAALVADFGPNAIGGCCGSTPDHIRALVELLGRTTARHRPAPAREPMVASAMRSVALDQEPRPLIVGERVNTQGSRRVKELVLADDYDGVLAVAREQVDFGAHVLDVCMALTERADEPDQMAHIVKKLAMGVEAPLMIDSTEPDAVEAALATYPGRAIVNSINMENGRERIERVVPLVRRHGAAVVALTIDEAGMAQTADEKLRVARKIHDIVVGEYGLAPEDLIFDALTFTLATGGDEYRHSAVETIEGIRKIKAELPGVYTSLGVSNVSFGLEPAARATINSVFLGHAVEAGLDLAMVNPAHIRPLAEIPADERTLAEDLIFDRRPDALARLISHFEGTENAPVRDASTRFDGLSADERIFQRILQRVPEGAEDDIDTALDERGARANDEAIAVLNGVLLPAMKEVGDRFGRGELILPYVLQSAEVMKRSVAHLEQYLDQVEGYTKGTVVLATVYGDVHDIGKNLVGTILKNNGYTVVDLGRQVPLNVIIDAAVEHGADAIGASALLVSTSRQMPLLVRELDARGHAFPVLFGGAAINRAFGRRTLFLEDGEPYGPGVFYCKDAFEGLGVVDQLRDPELAEALRATRLAEAVTARDRPPPTAQPDRPQAERVVLDRAAVPAAPFLGVRRVEGIDPAEMFARMDEKSLYRLSWGGKGVHGEEFERLVAEEFLPMRERLQREALADGWIVPRACYGYFPAASDGDDLVVFDPASGEERARFPFPRQPEGRRLCIADYFRPVADGERDVVAFQLVTVGREATAHLDRLQQEDRYTDAYFAHGLAVEAAEGLADLVHARIRAELGLGIDQGRRYSWGYPACPDLEQHELVLGLLAPEAEELGVELTAAWQFMPEQTTAAIVAHHPQATYFSARRGNRAAEDQEGDAEEAAERVA